MVSNGIPVYNGTQSNNIIVVIFIIQQVKVNHVLLESNI